MQLDWSGPQQALQASRSQLRRMDRTINGAISLVSLIAVLGCVLPTRVQAQATPPSAASNMPWPPSRFNCSPVTPDTKVPFIETVELEDLSRDFAYFEACNDRDYAWTPQSYPNPKYDPLRSVEHQARALLLLSGLKRYVAAGSEDWVFYVNNLLGASLPAATVERRQFADVEDIRSISYARNHSLEKLGTTSEILGIYSTRRVPVQGTAASEFRDLSITGIDVTHLCITPMDLKQAFDNQPGYLLRPFSIRTAQNRPTDAELARLGGQWFGYEVSAFPGSVNGNNSAVMRFGFGFKPCAARITVHVTSDQAQGVDK